jgi:hypothetical protein
MIGVAKFDPKIYGIHWDKTSPSVVYRTHDAIGMIAGVGLDSNTSYNQFDYAQIYDQITTVTDTYGNSFVRIPKFYIKKWSGANYYAKAVSLAPMSGGYLPWCFWDFTNSKELPYIDIGCYLGSRDGSLMESKSGTYPERNLSSVSWRTAAEANNTGGLLGYQQLDVHTWDVIQTLMDIEFGTFDIQSIMTGYTNGRYSAADTLTADSSGNILKVANATGAYYEIGQHISVGTSLGGFQRFYGRKIINIEVDTPGAGTTTITYDGDNVDCITGDIMQNSPWLNGWSSVMNASSGGIGSLTSGKFPMVWRGIENIFGNVYQWVDGINIDGGSTWTDTTDYYIGDLVIGWDGAAETTNTYVCTADHTSSAATRPTSGTSWATVWENLNGRQTWVCKNADDYVSNLFASPYEKLSYVNAPTSNWIQSEGYDSSLPFCNLPDTVSGTSTYLRDYYYQSTGARVARVGGYLSSGSLAGLRRWDLNYSSSSAGWFIGGRLLKKALI